MTLRTYMLAALFSGVVRGRKPSIKSMYSVMAATWGALLVKSTERTGEEELMPIFSLCHTTRRLPSGWVEAANLWIERADHLKEVEYILSGDVGCSILLETDYPCWWATRKTKIVTNTGRRCAAEGWNTCVRESSGDFIITVSDDLFPPDHWDTAILKVIPDLQGEYVLAADFGGNYPLMTFSFLTRAYLKRLERDHGYEGGVFYPGYLGMRADNDFDACARLDGVVIEAPHLKFEHKHPHYGTAPWDDTYRWQHRPEAYQVGDTVWERRQAEGFRA